MTKKAKVNRLYTWELVWVWRYKDRISNYEMADKIKKRLSAFYKEVKIIADATDFTREMAQTLDNDRAHYDSEIVMGLLGTEAGFDPERVEAEQEEKYRKTVNLALLSVAVNCVRNPDTDKARILRKVSASIRKSMYRHLGVMTQYKYRVYRWKKVAVKEQT
jgi:hypothetical protein